MNFKVTPLSLKKKIICELGCQLGKINVKEHVLREIFWECTLRCNLNCRHCGSDCRKTSDFKDMPMEDFLRVLDNVPHQPKQGVHIGDRRRAADEAGP